MYFLELETLENPATPICVLGLLSVPDAARARTPGCEGSPFQAAVGGRRVYVGNLAWGVSWQDLKDHFRGAGEVAHADVLFDAETGRSKGCGLVEFSSPGEAQRAVATLHQTELKGRLIMVRADREDFARGGAAHGSRLYVGNLSWQVKWHDLKDHFANLGFRVKHAQVLVEEASGRSKGCGLVTLYSQAEAMQAMELAGQTEIMGRCVECEEGPPRVANTKQIPCI